MKPFWIVRGVGAAPKIFWVPCSSCRAGAIRKNPLKAVRATVIASCLALIVPLSGYSASENTSQTNRLLPIVQGGRYGYADSNGKVIIEPRFDRADEFAEWLAAVAIGKKWGYIDQTGTVVIEPRYDIALPFSDGLGYVLLTDEQNPDGKWVHIEKNGKVVIGPGFDNVYFFLKG